MDLMARRRAIMGMPSGKDYTVTGNVVSISNALAKNAKSLIVSFSPKQSGSGDPSPSNVRPISGYNDIGAVRTGKNVFGGEDMADNITTNLSSATKNTTNKTVSFGYNAGGALATVISGGFFKPNTVYTLIFSALNATIARSNLAVVYTDGTSSVIGMTKTNEKETLRFVTNSSKSVSYIGLQRQGGTTVLYYEECGIFVGNIESSAFEPYISPVTAYVHSDTALFGGTVDLVSGECVVDRVFETITGNSNWYSFSTGTGNSSAVVQLNHWNNVKYISGNSSYNGAIGSSGREAQNYWTNPRQNEVPNEGDMAFAYSSGGQLRVHRNDVANITDLASFKSAFVDLQICYPLATPITYQLTPSQLALLKGNNTVYSNEGSISLTYVGK